MSEQEIFEYMMYDPMTTKADPHNGVADLRGPVRQMSPLRRPRARTTVRTSQRSTTASSVATWSRPCSTRRRRSRTSTTPIASASAIDVFEGLIMDQDDTSVTVLLPEEERPVKFEKSKVEIEKSDVSIMPEGLLDGYDMRKISALFAYLQQGPNLDAKPAEASGGE